MEEIRKLKLPKSFDEQLEILLKYNMIIEDRDKAIDILRNIYKKEKFEGTVSQYHYLVFVSSSFYFSRFLCTTNKGIRNTFWINIENIRISAFLIYLYLSC